ncbi:NUDIX domain-containing protein [Candidatus Kaiserbacteria bacterium]|nr:NUDIX domain-containing protein [Candidatus Kaiserbacteria bacterium]
MSENNFERGSAGESETDYKAFRGEFVIDQPSEKADDPLKETSERRAGIKRLAQSVLGLPEASWADLAKAGGYARYLQEVERLCKYKQSLDEGEKYVDTWAQKEGVSVTKVSGMTIFRGTGVAGGPLVDQVLLSVTKNKAWTHQPFGGKRNDGEGAVAAMLRELGEEAGWESASQLLEAFKVQTAFYVGYYVQKLSDKKALLIQSFSMNGQGFNTQKFVSGSDSSDYIWADRKFFEERGKDISLTEQAEKYMRDVFGFPRPPSKFTNPDERYYGTPDALYEGDGSNALPSNS